MFVTAAYAQTAGAAPSPITSIMPIILMIGIMYLLVFRPQQKKMKEHRLKLEAVRRGDEVVTGGGIMGKVTKVHEDGFLDVEIASGVKVKVLKATLADVVSKTEPA